MTHDVTDSNVMADINMTPMVDVMLVLLIIFMVVTPALLAGFNAQLPQGVNLKERPDDEARTTLGIDDAGNYYINKQPVDRADAPVLLAAEFERHPEDLVLFVKADRQLRYGEITEAMRIARTAGAVLVAAVTESQPDHEDDRKER